jgi:Raf kinase inhibitor-like YbhB/YbcL family protein
VKSIWRNLARSIGILICAWISLLPARAAGLKADAMELRSSAFEPDATIPRKYTCDGENVSPPLHWSRVPPATKSLALIADDPDAPGGIWSHWVVYDLPPNVAALGENTPKTESLANGSKQGVNDFQQVGYGGPCPPPGSAHRYFFRLYALDRVFELKPKTNRQQLLAAIQDHSVGAAELVGRYLRQR